MEPRLHPCNADRLRRLAEDQLEPAELAELEEHLHGCLQCQETLDRQAGADRWLGTVRRYLEGDPDAAGTVAAESLDFLSPSDWPDSLGRVGPYEVRGVLGRGGMGLVLKATDPALNRTVAIKVLSPHLAASGAARQRFLREARAAAAVVHEHVVGVYAVDEARGLPYLVMEYVPGGSLQDRLDRQGPLSLRETLRIGMQAAAGLAAAHAQGLVHRDIKPANILLENGVERARLTDFGLARAMADAGLTQSGVVCGTPQYMAPEQARAGAIDRRADLFSLGSTLYAMCAGYPPFRAETAVAVLRCVSDEEPLPLREANADVPPWLAALIARLHAKDPAQRYQSATEVADLLARCLAHLQQPLTAPLPEGLVRKGPRLMRGGRWMLAGILALGLLLVGVFASLPRQALQHDQPDHSPELPDLPVATAQSPPAPKLSQADPVDDQIRELRERAEQIRADIDRRTAPDELDPTAAEIRRVRERAQSLEQEIRAGAAGAPARKGY